MQLTAKVRAGAALALAVGAGFVGSSFASGRVHQCGNAKDAGQAGLGVTDVRARGISCTKAKHVATKTRATSRKRTTTTVVDGESWACRITQAATGSEPGTINTTKVTCSGPNHALLLYHLHS